jgi:hypothetical protein
MGKQDAKMLFDKHTNLTQGKLKREIGNKLKGETGKVLKEYVDTGADYIKKKATRLLAGKKKQKPPAPQSFGKQTKWGKENAFGRNKNIALGLPMELQGGELLTTRRPPKYQEVYLPANGNLLHQVPIVRRVVGGSYAGNGYVTGGSFAGNSYA